MKNKLYELKFDPIYILGNFKKPKKKKKCRRGKKRK